MIVILKMTYKMKIKKIIIKNKNIYKIFKAHNNYKMIKNNKKMKINLVKNNLSYQ